MNNAPQTFAVTEEVDGMRCDLWLAKESKQSRSAVQRLIKEGRVQLDGKTAIPHQPVHAGQQALVLFPEMIERHRTLVPTVVTETDEYLILEKPSGLLVHQTPRARETTLTDWLLERIPSIASIGSPERPGIVHRIDRDVSGLLIVAKTQAFFEWIQMQFRERRVQKQYIALVTGTVKNEEGTIDFPIARSERRRGRMAARPVGAEGKSARTRYSVRTRYNHATLLDVEIESGRTHQIRAHLFGIGHPVVGDSLYRAKHLSHLPDLDRPFLHAARLQFRTIDGEEHAFQSALPAVLQHYLDALPGKNPS